MQKVRMKETSGVLGATIPPIFNLKTEGRANLVPFGTVMH